MAARLRERITAARLTDEWLRVAQPGARQLYGVGSHASTACGEGVPELMRHAAAAGVVQLLQRRRCAEDCAAGYPFDYLAVRTAKPWPAGGVGPAAPAKRAYRKAQG